MGDFLNYTPLGPFFIIILLEGLCWPSYRYLQAKGMKTANTTAGIQYNIRKRKEKERDWFDSRG